MKLKKIPLAPYKKHRGQGSQLSYKGQPLSPIEQILATRYNEIIDELNQREKA